MNLENLIRSSKTKFVEYLNPIYCGTDKEVIQEKLKEAIENNQEGLMLNLFDAAYECKRSKGLLKIKQFKDADVLVANLTGQDGKIREAVSMRLNEFMSNEKYLPYFQVSNNYDIFLDAIIDINANICRNVISAITNLKNDNIFCKQFCTNLAKLS